MKLLFLLLILEFSFFLSVFSQNSNILAATASQAYLNEPVKDEPNIIRGWLRFFTFTPDFYTKDMPTKFEYNPSYLAQFSFGRMPGFTDKDKDEYGYYNIPSDTHFFFVLTTKTLYVINARRNDIAKTYKSLEIAWLFPEEIDTFEMSKYIGGLEDIGNFREGFCFRLKSKTRIVWNVCADTLDVKLKWMKAIYSIMEKTEIKVEGSGESLVIAPEIKLPFNISGGAPPLPESGPIMISKNGSAINGRWVILQDWSQCTQACGGGKQYLQRMCVPPQNGGKPCEGETILTKDCNVLPCPNVIEHQSEGEANPTMLKMQKLWTRPQRYEVCIIKEGDMDMLLDDGDYAYPPRFPVRVILNNRTLSVFTTPSYDSVYKSFDLKFLDVKINRKDPKLCLSMEDTRDLKKTVGLCIMPTALKRNQSFEVAKKEWIDDVAFFRDKCHENAKYVEESDEIAAKRLMVDMESKEDHYDRIREKEEEDKQKQIENRVETTAHYALEAVEKEIKFEQLAIEEELMREKEADSNLQHQIDDEDYKKHCLEREIKRKAKIKQLERQTTDMSSRIKRISQQAMVQVKSSRESLLQKIQAMQRAAERRRRDAKRKVTTIRSSMAQSLLKENKIGNYTICFPNRTKHEREGYCRENFHVDDPEKESDCLLSNIDYCSVCCENEFGSNQDELRTKCYNMCDEEDAKPDEVCIKIPNENRIDADYQQDAMFGGMNDDHYRQDHRRYVDNDDEEGNDNNYHNGENENEDNVDNEDFNDLRKKYDYRGYNHDENDDDNSEYEEGEDEQETNSHHLGHIKNLNDEYIEDDSDYKQRTHLGNYDHRQQRSNVPYMRKNKGMKDNYNNKNSIKNSYKDRNNKFFNDKRFFDYNSNKNFGMNDDQLRKQIVNKILNGKNSQTQNLQSSRPQNINNSNNLSNALLTHTKKLNDLNNRKNILNLQVRNEAKQGVKVGVTGSVTANNQTVQKNYRTESERNLSFERQQILKNQEIARKTNI